MWDFLMKLMTGISLRKRAQAESKSDDRRLSQRQTQEKAILRPVHGTKIQPHNDFNHVRCFSHWSVYEFHMKPKS